MNPSTDIVRSGRIPVRVAAARYRGVLAAGTFGLLAAAVAAGCGGTNTVTVTSPAKTVTVSSPAETETATVTAPAKAVTAPAPGTSGFGAPKPVFQFGYIRSLTRKGPRFELRFDPAWLVSGVTANTAAAEDMPDEAGQGVPNDNYIVDEGHRLLTYLVPATAHVTVFTNGGSGELATTPITVSQLAQIVTGKSHLKLFEPITTGFWIAVSVDTVRELDQEYRA